MPRSLLLVHSPLVGPSSLRRLAGVARNAGHEVALPDLTSVAAASQPHELYLRLAAEPAMSMSGPVFVVGHSGAGAFLPAIGEAIQDLAGLVFVDAVVPPRKEAHRTTEGFRAMLDQHTRDGRLDRWLDWWPVEVVVALLPDPKDRAELSADMPHLSRAFYHVDVDVPSGWSDDGCGFVRLSGGYEAEAEEARSRGWPTLELDSTHLGVHTAPDNVLTSVLHLVAQLDVSK